jgi:DNA gyrase inhibitor GyrI
VAPEHTPQDRGPYNRTRRACRIQLKSCQRAYFAELVNGVISKSALSCDTPKVATAWDHLYRDWLTNSAYEPEHAPALEVFLDKESAADWSHFESELCLPVRKPTKMRS